jgi:hypothetical protein
MDERICWTSFCRSFGILIIVFNTIETLQEAKEELAKAKKELAAEREFILQQQRAGTLYFNLCSSYFFLSARSRIGKSKS